MMRRVIAMRTLRIAFLVLLLVPATRAYADNPSPSLTDEEFAELIKSHDQSQNMLLGLISGLSDEQWTFKQNAKRWSVGECVEHIVRSEHALFQSAVKAMENPPDPEWYARTKGKAAFIRKIIPNRNPNGVGGAKAPQEIQPTEKWGRAKAIEEFYKIHGQVRAYIETMPREIKNHTVKHPFPIFGWLNAYDWLLYLGPPLQADHRSAVRPEISEESARGDDCGEVGVVGVPCPTPRCLTNTVHWDDTSASRGGTWAAKPLPPLTL
jgi:DinB superfamily